MRTQTRHHRRTQFGGHFPIFRGSHQYGGLFPVFRPHSRRHPHRQIGGDFLDDIANYTGPIGMGLNFARKFLDSKLQQSGKGLNVFRGGDKYQYGEGWFDILKSVGKFAAPLIKKAAPVVLKTAKKLVKHAIANREQGQSWGESFREAAPRAAYTALKGAAPEETTEDADQPQKGSGRRRHRRVYKHRDLLRNDISGRPLHYNF